VLADSTIALSFIVIAIYFNHEVINKLILILLTVNNLIINVDIFHFYRYQFRINNFFLESNNILSFIHAERPVFAIILGFNFILYFFGTRLVRQNACLKRNKLKLLILVTFILHFTQVLPTKAPENHHNSWETFYAYHNLINKTATEISSFHQLIYKKFKSIFPDPVEVFLQSPFLVRFQRNFPVVARKTLKQFDLKKEEKIWSHSAFNSRFKLNTPEGAVSAIKNGFSGIEIDVQYSASGNKIVICHDKVSEEILKSKQSLQEFVHKVYPGIAKLKYLWLDFKNLNFYNFDQSAKLLKKAKDFIPEHTELFIETRDAFISRMLVQNGFKTIFAIGYGIHSFKLTNEKAFLYRSLIVLSRCSMVSITSNAWKKINNDKALGQFPVCLYTVNDKEELQNLANKKNVIAILTDLELILSELFP
jgi:hypothetical protein